MNSAFTAKTLDILRIDDPLLVQANFRKFLENKLREHFSLDGVPISMRFMQK